MEKRHYNGPTRVFIELEDFSELEALEELRRKKRREYANTEVYALILPDFTVKEISKDTFEGYYLLGYVPDNCVLCQGKRWQIKQGADELKRKYRLRLEAEGKIKPGDPKRWG